MSNKEEKRINLLIEKYKKLMGVFDADFAKESDPQEFRNQLNIYQKTRRIKETLIKSAIGNKKVKQIEIEHLKKRQEKQKELFNRITK